MKSVTTRIDWVGVYDVGQGSAAALCDVDGVPMVYVDLGGGVMRNTGTFPQSLHDFCFTQSPPVILSHWDWDHWSSGTRFQQAANMKWIVPNQKLGAVHATFAATLATNSNLLVWPAKLSSVQSGQTEIIKCTGSGRNHSGLAVSVGGPQGDDPILLPGDARYAVIGSATSGKYTSVVVPHHGADMRNRAVPAGLGYQMSRAVYSCGISNTFCHPWPVTERDHDKHGWPHAAAGATNPVDRRTTRRGSNGLGHIGLTWKPAPLPTGHCKSLCGLNSCSLQLTQS